MIRNLMPLAAALAACAPSPQENVMPSPVPASATTAPSAAKNSATPGTDTPAAALGRRTLSTAFVMVGPDNRLTVDLRDGRVLALRNVVMRPNDYCGMQLLGGSRETKFCGGYADVAAARPGDAPPRDRP